MAAACRDAVVPPPVIIGAATLGLGTVAGSCYAGDSAVSVPDRVNRLRSLRGATRLDAATAAQYAE